MSGTNHKPTRWYYVLALFIPDYRMWIDSHCLIYRNVPKLSLALWKLLA